MSREGWLILDLDKINVKDKDKFCKKLIADPKTKMPLAYVDKQGNIHFNKTALRFIKGDKENTKQALKEDWRLRGKIPIVICLTNSLRKLVKVGAGDILVTHLEGSAYKEHLGVAG